MSVSCITCLSLVQLQQQHMLRVRNTLIKEWFKEVEDLFRAYVDDNEVPPNDYIRDVSNNVLIRTDLLCYMNR